MQEAGSSQNLSVVAAEQAFDEPAGELPIAAEEDGHPVVDDDRERRAEDRVRLRTER